MDQYDRATQLVPAAAVLAPLSVLVVVTVRTDDLTSVIRSVVGILAAAGFHVVAMRLVRDRGNTVQERLWRSWGGSTTVARLRWRDRPDTEVSRLHHRVQTTTGVRLPTRAQEQNDPAAAEEAYADAAGRLRETTRDHARFPRVWTELKQYGTARNLYGVKPAGLIVTAAVLATSIVMTTASATETWKLDWWLPAIAGGAALLTAFIWIALITPSFVRTASERYSDALLATAVEPDTGD